MTVTNFANYCKAISQAELSRFVDTHQIIDVVRQFPAVVNAQSFVDSLRKLSPRSYSIASSGLANPDEVHLTVAAVRYSAFGSEHWGAASTHLSDRLDEGDSVQVYIEENSRFRLPSDHSTDVIMIGPGTGVAPFRAFVEERAETNASGRNWLFFGDRNFSSDFPVSARVAASPQKGKSRSARRRVFRVIKPRRSTFKTVFARMVPTSWRGWSAGHICTFAAMPSKWLAMSMWRLPMF